jgi:3-oxoacyl-[acyl-carrier-protein] synthase-1
MGSKRIFITGLGAITAIGKNVEENLASLLAQKSGVGKIEILYTAHADEFPAAEIKLTDSELKAALGLQEAAKESRTTLLGMMAAREAMKQAGNHGRNHLRTGLISATTVGGMNTTEEYFFRFEHEPDTQVWIDKLDCGDSTKSIARLLGIKNYITTISTACSSSANAIMHGAELIKAGLLDRALCGGTDALSRFTLNGFNSLMLLEKEWCRPFDIERKGLNLGEGAGFIMLESEESVRVNKSQILAELVGYANTNDAFHQTAASPDGKGAFTAMSGALKKAGITADKIDYINVHGTGTPNNDESESMGMKTLFGDKIPPFSSTKPYTGHTLGAAGGVEAVFSVLSILHGCIWPSLNFKNKMKEVDFGPQTSLIKNLNIEYVLSNSFGFGGNNTSLLFANYKTWNP